ncbi:hypothetical protein F751_5455 [Auxenochlorella protothecoides]|uniref:Uncharacterized protein n=1 Tax=Auxenochlorella protothecoides TaxID=3075 RepID=A0A087SQ86_AUXPR|nr:hypothetical protein F751_5455 [Auxenochlorella protothecoides]KFM27890.1 hypothetical protein F751_5455 [Auxenochlorella protothecoides]
MHCHRALQLRQSLLVPAERRQRAGAVVGGRPRLVGGGAHGEAGAEELERSRWVAIREALQAGLHCILGTGHGEGGGGWTAADHSGGSGGFPTGVAGRGPPGGCRHSRQRCMERSMPLMACPPCRPIRQAGRQAEQPHKA